MTSHMRHVGHLVVQVCDGIGEVYIRYQSPMPGPRGVPLGIFALANGLAWSRHLSDQEYAEWRASNDWYNVVCPDPSATDPLAYDRERNPLAAAWFKESATHLLERVTPYLEILGSHGVACVRVEAEDPGRIIYEDDVQVVVVPRRDQAHPFS